MNQDFDIEALRKLVADVGLRPAAKLRNMDHNKLYRLLRKMPTSQKVMEAEQQLASKPEAQPEQVPEPAPENLTPFSLEEWDIILRPVTEHYKSMRL